MFKKILIGLIIFFLLAKTATAADYTIDNFKSVIEINQDTSIIVTETIEANFKIPKHGIFRYVPEIYSVRGKTLKTRMKYLSVTDESGKKINFTTSMFNQSVEAKIGDADKTLTGKQTYVIKYQVKDVLQRYADYDELYWNVTGHEWDTTIAKAAAEVISPYAKILKRQDYTEPEMTIVVALDKNSELIWPTKIETAIKTTTDNFGYPLALVPLFIMTIFWWKKGRDKRYLTDNLYVKDHPTKTVPLFEHKFLPSVYSPIDNVTAGEAGIIIDQKMDTKDLIAEILELGRLGFLTIKREEKKKFLGKEAEYILTKKNKETGQLRDYQKYLLEKLFINKEEVKLSELKNKFYLYLEEFRKKTYQHLSDEKIFDGNPQKVTGKWTGIYAAIMAVIFLPLLINASITLNYIPVAIYILGIFPAALIIKNMPARTAWGYSLYRQIEGLKWFLGKGKWREEISEKNLFLGEMLPLAVALGVVNKLAKDMKDLGVPPPNYCQGFVATSWARDFNAFSMQGAVAVTSSPSGVKWTGSASWSGHSGFSSGGGGGGGFGGGGGGSW
jgi:uncharacterized membrane protein